MMEKIKPLGDRVLVKRVEHEETTTSGIIIPDSAKEKAHIRYVAIKLGIYYCRIFYVTPLVSFGDSIKPDTVIGISQCLGEFYEGITEHVHVEFYKLIVQNYGEHDKNNFSYIDPRIALEVMGGA